MSALLEILRVEIMEMWVNAVIRTRTKGVRTLFSYSMCCGNFRQIADFSKNIENI